VVLRREVARERLEKKQAAEALMHQRDDRMEIEKQSHELLKLQGQLAAEKQAEEAAQSQAKAEKVQVAALSGQPTAVSRRPRRT